MPERKTGPDNARLDRVVAEARRAREERAAGYREQALKIYPWICGRCGRDFTHTNLQLLEVHHRDHNHDNNPPMAATGSYCAHTVTRMSTSGSLPSKAGIQSCLARADRRRLRTNHSPT